MNHLEPDPRLVLIRLSRRTLPWIHLAGRILRLDPEASSISDELLRYTEGYRSRTYSLNRKLVLFRFTATGPSRVVR